MEEEKKINPDTTETSSEMALDDARRVKVLSPTQLVIKRFFRNRLAIVGLVVLIIMFSFSFIGPLFSKYGQSQVFKGNEIRNIDYATAVVNSQYRVVVMDGKEFSDSALSAMTLAISTQETIFEAGDVVYALYNEGENLYHIGSSKPVCTAFVLGKNVTLTDEEGYSFSTDSQFTLAFNEARMVSEELFSYNGNDYAISGSGKNLTISQLESVAMASILTVDAFLVDDKAYVSSYDFRFNFQKAYSNGESVFTVNNTEYTIDTSDEDVIIKLDGKDFATASDIIIESKQSDVVLKTEFKEAAREAITAGETKFSCTLDGKEQEFNYSVINGIYYIKSYSSTQVILTLTDPSKEHPLGLDANGMDVLTRLMYGGRISLMVGFIVVFIEIILGVIIGGISGYFGGHIDNVIMRVVDLVNSIPFWPMMLIIGAVMDALQMNSTVRISVMMMVLGALSWTGIARVVRGQILTLREQEFMIATEATGIRVSRRIFKHLVPNVMPLLIVQATMGLGDVILTEATLGYIGLGVKYPLASWGSVINQANDIQIMSNCWYIWIPAGLLILLSVLGFNFIGDGLRDAFDPKMKR